MFDSLWAWAQAHPGQAAASVGIAGFGLYAVYAYWDVIEAWWSKGTTTVTTPKTGTVPTRREVLDYLDAAYTYFQSVGCTDGMEAIEQAVSHAFHEHPQQPLTTPTEAATQIANIIGAALHQPTTAAPTTTTTNEPPAK